MEDSKIYKLAIVIVGTIGTILVSLNVLDVEQAEALKGLVPALIGVVMQVIAFLQSIGIINKKEADVVELKHQMALKVKELEIAELKAS